MRPIRLTTPEMIALYHEISASWIRHGHAHVPYLVPWVATKMDHGDMDLVVPVTVNEARSWAVASGIPAGCMVENGHVLSVPVPVKRSGSACVAQVDFITCAPGRFRAMCFYLSGGDVGMMIGRIARAHGMVFGMDGLRYRADPSCHWEADVLLTDDPQRILDVLGYAGPPDLTTYESLWAWALSSPMAGPWMFTPEATTSENRNRERSRPSAGRMLDWLRATYPDIHRPVPPSREEILAWIDARFPEVCIRAMLDHQHALWTYRKEVRKWFGTGLVASIAPGMSDADAHLLTRHLMEGWAFDRVSTPEGWMSTWTDHWHRASAWLMQHRPSMEMHGRVTHDEDPMPSWRAVPVFSGAQKWEPHAG
jgi:hypothetical protein